MGAGHAPVSAYALAVAKTPRPAAQPADPRLARVFVGYRRRDVEARLGTLRAELQGLTADRARLAARLEQLEAELARHRELEALQRSTLVSVDRAADELRQRERAETDLLLDEANAGARRLTAAARAEAELLEHETAHRRERLRAALLTVEAAIEEAPAQEPVAENPTDPAAEPAAPAAETIADTLQEQIRRVDVDAADRL